MKTSISPIPSSPGAYVLLLEIHKTTTIKVGRRLGPIKFQPGFYAYIGSALNGLAARLNRHLRRHKKLHWHVDYLLEKAQLSELIWAQTSERLECRIANILEQQGLSSIPRFGSSDCRCLSHLFHSPTLQPLRRDINHASTTLGVTPHLYNTRVTENGT